MKNLQEATERICELKGSLIAVDVLLPALVAVLPTAARAEVKRLHARHAEAARTALLHGAISELSISAFEREVLRTIPGVLAITDAVVIEWHKWVTPREDVDAILAASGLTLNKIIAEDPHCGVALYSR